MTDLYSLIKDRPEMPKDKKYPFMSHPDENLSAAEIKGANRQNALWLAALKQIEAPVEAVEKPVLVDEDFLRKYDGYIHVGEGCEIAIRGTTKKLNDLESVKAPNLVELDGVRK